MKEARNNVTRVTITDRRGIQFIENVKSPYSFLQPLWQRSTVPLYQYSVIVRARSSTILHILALTSRACHLNSYRVLPTTHHRYFDVTLNPYTIFKWDAFSKRHKFIIFYCPSGSLKFFWISYSFYHGSRSSRNTSILVISVSPIPKELPTPCASSLLNPKAVCPRFDSPLGKNRYWTKPRSTTNPQTRQM